MSDKTLQRLPLALAALLTCVSAHADFTSEDGKARLSGFGTLGAARTSTDDALFNYRGQGGGVDKSVGMEPDTKVGVQGSYKFTNTISGTAQVLTKYRASGQYQPEFEWAFLKWQALPSLSVRAGRIGAPYFMISDFRDVGYANTPVRPNLDVYGQVPVSSFDGVDLTYQTELSGANVSATLWGGHSRSDFASTLRSTSVTGAVSVVDPIVVKIKNTLGLNIQAELENGLSIRLGRAAGALTIDSGTSDAVIRGANALAASSTLQALGYGARLRADAEAVTAALTTKGARASFSGIGLAYDQDNIVLSGEFTKRKIKKGYIPSTTGWYALGGYRFGSVLPYVSYSKIKVDDQAAVPGFAGASALVADQSTIGGIIGAQNAAAVSANARSVIGGTNAVLNSQKLAQKTLSIGLRWDATRSLAVKTQFDRISKPADSYGNFLVPDLSADYAKGNSSFLNKKQNINVISVAVDFVF